MDNGTADLLLELVPGYSGLPHATLEDFGGEVALLQGGDPEHGLTGTVALCAGWSELGDTAAAAAFIEHAASVLDPSELIAFNDVVLATPAALPELAAGLSRAWSRMAAEDSTLLGNIAVEGWTRLALGGWCSKTLPVRAALADRGAAAVAGQTVADSFLVRSIAAAADVWPERDLLSALEDLTGLEDVETDAAFELGMLHLREAVEADEFDEAISSLIAARDHYRRACIEDDRPDAAAFLAACEAVHAFATGQSVSRESVTAVEDSALIWLHGYLGEDPHWRQSRSEAAPQWAALIRALNAVADLNEPAWYDTAALLADTGRLYVAYNSTTLLTNPQPAHPATALTQGTSPGATSGGQVATPAILGPRLDAGLAESADKLRLVDRWLELQSERTDDPLAVAAIADARQRMRDPKPPGKAPASRDGLPDDVREALDNRVEASSFEEFERASKPLHTPTRPIPILIRRVRDRLLRELQAVRPDAYADWAIHLAGIVGHYVNCISDTIDHQQGGQRNLPWHNPIARGERPGEHYLADHLATWFTALHYLVTTEGTNIAGGRADVAIWVDTERFVIEVKQIAVARSNDELSADYGPQAQQYTMTAAPFAFLAVLDNKPRVSRIDLESSLWTSSWTNAETAVVHGLTGARVLAEVQTPSSQPSQRRKPAKKTAARKRTTKSATTK